MPVTKQDLIAELSRLVQWTAVEEAVARTRSRFQARNPETARELLDNADAAARRRELLQQAITRLGAPKDRVAPVAGKAIALAKTQFEQATTLGAALLADLQLEHLLRDRARFVRGLAETLDQPQVVALSERLERAHTETIDWISLRLQAVAREGEGNDLDPTPMQRVVAVSRRVSLLPLTSYAEVLGRAGDLLSGVRTRVAAAAAGTAATAADGTSSVADTVADAADTAADATRSAAESMRDFPVKSYDVLAGDAIIAHFGEMDDADDVRRVLDHERAGKHRKGVIAAAEARLAALEATG